MKPKKFVSPTTKGIQCYNCLSFDHPGCWDPDHPDYANITVRPPPPHRGRQLRTVKVKDRVSNVLCVFVCIQVPNIDCYIPGMAFLCIVITSESAKLGEHRRRVG